MLFVSFSVAGTTYYIDPSGKDSNTGTSTSPWKSLAFACSKVTSPGDIIHVNTGTYTETAQSVLAVGVSIEGTGVTSIIQSSVGGSSFTISLYSSKEGTNGNQHISNMKMDGSALTAYGAIKIDKRSNVEIFNCTFVDFNYYGVGFDGDGTGNQPTTYPTGNKFHDNTVINCSGYFTSGDKDYGDGKYAVGVNGQNGLLIYNNTLTQTSRTAGNNGYLIKGVAGYNKGIKIYNNTITKASYDNLTWDFAIELWLCRGGVEIYNNKITGGSIDISGSSNVSGISNQKGEYDYSVWIHDNEISQSILSNYEGTHGILIEQSAENVIIERNIIRNVCLGIYFPLAPKADGSGKILNNVDIRYNTLDNIGVADGGVTDGWGIYLNVAPRDYTNNSFNVYNNTIIGHIGAQSTYWGIHIPNTGTSTNVNIRNNIVENFTEAPIKGVGASGVSVGYLNIENNIFYNNGNNNLPKYSGLEIGQNTTQNNIVGNPLFVSSSDYHLQSNSSAISKGLTISGLSNDIEGNPLNSPPCIGAYEYLIGALPVYQSSVVENGSPSLLEINFNSGLANIVPANTAFIILINSVARTVNAITISGTKVQLTLSSPVIFGDIVTLSYSKPAINPLQNTSGDQVAGISSKLVSNNCIKVNKTDNPPFVVVNYPKTVYEGFVNEIDATSTYNPNNDPLVVEWGVPNNVSVSTVKSLKTQFLAPVVDNSEIVNFELKVSDGKTLVIKDLPISVLPYKPESLVARITSIETSSYQASDNPTNIIDGNTSTKWSSNGDNQWLLIKLADPFKISHIVLAFLDGQSYESYFDIFASNDNVIWDHILSGVASCKFSGKRQIFDFPDQFSNEQYSYVKYIGHDNSLNSLNIISEFKVFGILQKSTTSGNSSGQNIVIYPNPAQNFLNIAIEDPTINPNSIRIFDYSGKVILEDSFNQRTNRIELPSSIDTGIYIVEFRSGMITLDSQKLFVRR